VLLGGPIVTGILYFTKIIILKIRFSFDGSSTISTVGSNYGHYYASLGSIKNVQIVVGSFLENKKVESLRDGRWNDMGDFPFFKQYISHYSFVTFQDDLFIFGKIFIYQF